MPAMRVSLTAPARNNVQVPVGWVALWSPEERAPLDDAGEMARQGAPYEDAEDGYVEIGVHPADGPDWVMVILRRYEQRGPISEQALEELAWSLLVQHCLH